MDDDLIEYRDLRLCSACKGEQTTGGQNKSIYMAAVEYGRENSNADD